MDKRKIERFFNVLAENYKGDCRIILTGAGAGILYGHARSTRDLDFETQLKNPAESWEDFSKAVEATAKKTKTAAQYAENIDHWSLISLADYKKHVFLFKRFGRIEVRLLEPCYWAIGKLGRYFASDIRDLARVLKKTRVSWQELSEVCGKALASSPKSTACFQFRKQVENFFHYHGKKIWGAKFAPQKAVQVFHACAQIKI